MIANAYTYNTEPQSNAEINAIEPTLQSLTDQASRLQRELQESLKVAKGTQQGETE